MESRSFVQCLGSGNAFAAGGRFNPTYFLKTGTLGVLLDCGASALIALKRQNLSPEDVDVVLITHLHGDHFGGLPFMLCEILALRQRTKPLTIIGPNQTKERTEQALECFYPGVRIKSDSQIDFITYQTEEPLSFDRLRITAYRAIHAPATNPHILRVEAGGMIVTYSGDTEWTDNLLTAANDADLFICEASAFRKAGTREHLSVEELAEQRARIHAKKMVLTHLGEEALQHLDEIPFEVAAEGQILLEGGTTGTL